MLATRYQQHFTAERNLDQDIQNIKTDKGITHVYNIRVKQIYRVISIEQDLVVLMDLIDFSVKKMDISIVKENYFPVRIIERTDNIKENINGRKKEYYNSLMTNGFSFDYLPLDCPCPYSRNYLLYWKGRNIKNKPRYALFFDPFRVEKIEQGTTVDLGIIYFTEDFKEELENKMKSKDISYIETFEFQNKYKDIRVDNNSTNLIINQINDLNKFRINDIKGDQMSTQQKKEEKLKKVKTQFETRARVVAQYHTAVGAFQKQLEFSGKNIKKAKEKAKDELANLSPNTTLTIFERVHTTKIKHQYEEVK